MIAYSHSFYLDIGNKFNNLFLVPYLVVYIFPSLSISQSVEFISITRVLLLSPIFLGLSNFLASITQVYRRFLIYALSPLLYNIGIIIGIVFLYPIFGLQGLVYGVILGAIFHLSVQIPFVLAQGLIPRFSFSADLSGIKKVVFLSVPRTITLGVSQIALIFLVSLASRMSEGSISVFNFSLNLQSVPLSIIGSQLFNRRFPDFIKAFFVGTKGQIS